MHHGYEDRGGAKDTLTSVMTRPTGTPVPDRIVPPRGEGSRLSSSGEPPDELPPERAAPTLGRMNDTRVGRLNAALEGEGGMATVYLASDL